MNETRPGRRWPAAARHCLLVMRRWLASARRWPVVLRRRLGLEPSPLRRATDRAEAWARITLVLLFLAGAPAAAIAAGRWTDASMTAEARLQAATEQLVPATLLASTPADGS